MKKLVLLLQVTCLLVLVALCLRSFFGAMGGLFTTETCFLLMVLAFALLTIAWPQDTDEP